MHKKSIILIFFFATFFYSFSQNNNEGKSILIYSDGQGFLQPFIETTIKNLKKVTNEKYNSISNEQYFKEVNSLNTYISDNKYQAVLRDLIDTQVPEDIQLGLYYSENEKSIRERIFNILTEYDYFLVIKTNTLGELIEFQFQLYQTTNNKPNISIRNIPINISDRAIGVENFFINPKNLNYREDLKNAIHRLFKKSNKKPIAELKIFDQLVKSNETIKVPLDSKLIFNGASSGDYDSPNINYVWRNIPKIYEKIQTSNKIDFDDNKSIQEIIINKSGFYKIGFKVYDGIQYSDEIILELETFFKPLLVVADSIITSVEYKSIFKKQSPEKIYKGKINFLQTRWYDGFKNKILVSNQKIGNKFIKERHLSQVDSTAKIVEVKDSYDNLIIKSVFPNPDFVNERKLYLYSLSKYNLLSNEIVLTHKLKKRESVNLYFKGGISLLAIPKEEVQEGEEEEENFATFVPSLGLGLYLSKNIEVEFALALKSKSIIVKNTELRYPAVLESSIKYRFFSKDERISNLDNFYIGVLFKNYQHTTDDKSNPLKYKGLGFKIGHQERILNKDFLILDGLIEASGSKFINTDNSELDKIFDVGVNIGLAISF